MLLVWAMTIQLRCLSGAAVPKTDAVWGGEAAARINLSRGFSRIACLSRPLPPSRRPCPLCKKVPGDGMLVGVPL